jgi:hypothetical protein
MILLLRQRSKCSILVYLPRGPFHEAAKFKKERKVRQGGMLNTSLRVVRNYDLR